MTEALIVLAQLLITKGPEVASAWRKLFAEGRMPTDAEWDAILALVDKPGESYFPPVAPAPKAQG